MEQNYLLRTKEKSYSNDELCEGVRMVKEEGKLFGKLQNSARYQPRHCEDGL